MSVSGQKELNFEHLPRYQSRQFLDDKIDFDQLDNITSLYNRLLSVKIESSKQLEQWLLDRSEVEAALDQHGSILYIRMTCQTDDAQRAQAYTTYLEHIIPAIKPLEDQLNKKFLESLQSYPLDEERYGICIRAIKTDVKLFREANVDLQTQIDLLSQEYQKVCGSMTVNFKGKEQTMPQMSKYLLETDRALRQEAWEAITKRRMQDTEKLEDIFDQMVSLRDKVAINAGCSNFCDYKFRSLHRFDYTPEHCKEYHQAVERVVLPLYKKIMKARCEKMKLSKLKPWDTAVDPLGQKPLKPFEEVDDLITGCQKIFNNVDPVLGDQFSQMNALNLLDLASRKGKAPGGYQSSLNESRKPFIFMNSVGVDDDVRTLLHEGGHAFHSMACAGEPLIDYRHAPMEFNEVASMAMELLGGKYLDVFYNENDVKRSKEDHFEGVVFVLVWVAIIDAFQHWIYENPQHNQEERKQAWLDIRNRFDTDSVDWSGFEDVQNYMWHRQLHIFEVPFYYIEYGIAQLGALQLWLNSNKDQAQAIEAYRHALSLGGARPLPELYRTAGIKFDFTRETIAPLMEAIEAELFS